MTLLSISRSSVFPNKYMRGLAAILQNLGTICGSTRPSDTVSVTSILVGASDNAGPGIARRLVLKSGLSVILASNIPKNSPTLELNAEKKMVEKLISLG